MKLTKRLLIVSALLVIVALLAACAGGGSTVTEAPATAASGSNESSSSATESPKEGAAEEPNAATALEPITMHVQGNFGPDNQNGIMEDPVAQYIRENTGITIDLVKLPDSGDSQNKLNAQIAANDLPDLFLINGGDTQITNLVNASLIWPLDDLVANYAPNINADDWAKAMLLDRKLSSPDGNLYIMGMNKGYWDSSAMGPQRGFYIRWDLYKELGYPAITNTIELMDVLGKMVELEPANANGSKTYAAATWNNAFNDTAFSSQAIMMGYALGPFQMLAVDIETKEILKTNQLKDPNSLVWEALRWMNYLNRQGLLDTDSFTQTYQDYMDKTKAGTYMMGALTWSNGDANSTFIEAGTPEKQLICLPSNIFGWNKTSLYEYMIGGERGWAIAKSFDKPERAVQLLDFMSTFEFSRVAHNGPEGENWSIVNGVATLKPEYIALDGDGRKENDKVTGARMFRLFTGYASATPSSVDGQTVDLLSSARPLTETHKDFLGHYGKGTMHDVYAEGMNTYTKATKVNWGVLPEELIVYETQLRDYLNQGYVTVTMAKDDAQFAVEQEKFIAGMEPYMIDDIWQYYYDTAMSAADKVKPIYDLLGF